MYFLGIDIGSSSIKVAVLNGTTGKPVSSGQFPKKEMEIIAQKPGWAEQSPEDWWENTVKATQEALSKAGIDGEQISAIGISYQMHGLVVVDEQYKPLRPSIIWCDSRAVEIGDEAFKAIGGEKCLQHLLNSPGNFTASKLKWVKDNEPELFEKIWKIMLPGDYIAMKLTGQVCTTIEGLSEGIMWDFKTQDIATFLLDNYGLSKEVLPTIVPTFADQGTITAEAASLLGISSKAKVTYRAGDQPNNAFSLNVLEPGEAAATAGTSGVVYGVSEEVKFDPLSRVNTFAHVNYTSEITRLGVLLCINGTGILNSWLKWHVAGGKDYDVMNELAEVIPIGSEGLTVLPFGNGAERVLENKAPGASFHNLSFNTHKEGHMLRAAQEGIAFSFQYGLEIMQEMGVETSVIRAGKANLFLSPVFRNTLAGISGATIEMYETDGAVGAARASGVGIGYYSSFKEAFEGLEKLKVISPTKDTSDQYQEAYAAWRSCLNKVI